MSHPSSRRCEHVFDPGGRSDASADDYRRVTDEAGQWHCPHPATVGNNCPFHADPAETESIRAAFDAAVTDPDRPNEFLDATLGDLDLSYTVIDGSTNRPIDLRAARIRGSVTLTDATVSQRLRLDDAVVGELRCRRTTFHEGVSAERARVEATVDFRDARFERELYLSKTTFDGRCRWSGGEFAAGIYCHQARFGELNAHVTEYGGRADFSQASVENAQFPRATFHAEARFDSTTFGTASFAGVRFHDLTIFDETVLPERLSFDAATVHETLSFDGVHPADDGTTIGLRNAELAAGRLYPASDGTVVYDLRDATVGAVQLSDGPTPPDLLDGYRFLNTDFEGFDFGAYRDVLEAVDWRLHEVTGPLRTPPTEPDDFEPSPGDRESTFLKAKNGANEIGDTTAAAEFFRREMLARRDVHRRAVRRGDPSPGRRVTAAGQWVGNALLSATAGYGERPSRVVLTAVATIAVFTAGFWALLSRPPHDHPVGYLVVSLESFLTLVLPGGAPVPNPWVRLFALVEGFLGAFLVALFVFTLTRSIHR